MSLPRACWCEPAHTAGAEHKRAMQDFVRQIAGYAGAKDAAVIVERHLHTTTQSSRDRTTGL